MIAQAAALPTAPPAALPSETAADAHETTFRDVLSALNPLQYLPVVGTIYRAITGDSPPEALRVVGSMIVGGLMGGPFGVALSAVSNLVQHVGGFDLDHMAHDMMASIGLIDDDTPAVAQAAMPQAGVAEAGVAQAGALPARQVIAQAVATPAQRGSATAAEAISREEQARPSPPVQRQAAIAAYGQTLYTYGPGLGHA